MIEKGQLPPKTELFPDTTGPEKVILERDNQVTSKDIIAKVGSEYTRILQFAEDFKFRLQKARTMIDSNTQKMVYMEFAKKSINNQCHQMFARKNEFKEELSNQIRKQKKMNQEFVILMDEEQAISDQLETGKNNPDQLAELQEARGLADTSFDGINDAAKRREIRE